MIKVLFICLGNICRSPLAEAVFNHKVKEKKLDKFIESDSCGTSNYHIGKSPDHRSIQTAQNRGILIDHAGRQLSRSDLDNIKKLMDREGLSYPHLYLMREFQPNPSHRSEEH